MENFFVDMTDQFDPTDIEENKSVAAVACIPILFWIPLITANKDSQFAKFYSNQGLLLLIGGIVLGILGGILGGIFGLIPAVGKFLSALIVFVCRITPTAAFIYEIVAALQAKAKPIPIIGTMIQIIK
jgi:uncharacterized membrane protein